MQQQQPAPDGGGIWPCFLTFCDMLLRSAKEHLPDQACQENLHSVLMPVTQVTASDGEPVLRSYFEQPPSHVAAVNSLDHTLFTNDLVFPACTLSLRQAMSVFSNIPRAYGPLWLALLDVAQLANPDGVQADAGRKYIQQQLGVMVTPASGGGGGTAQLEGMLGSILGAFPGLQDCMSKIMASRDGSAPEADLNQVVDQVQNVLLGPILENMRATNPTAPDIGPAISQILSGFRGLNSAIASSIGSSDGGVETMDT